MSNKIDESEEKVEPENQSPEEKADNLDQILYAVTGIAAGISIGYGSYCLFAEDCRGGLIALLVGLSIAAYESIQWHKEEGEDSSEEG